MDLRRSKLELGNFTSPADALLTVTLTYEDAEFGRKHQKGQAWQSCISLYHTYLNCPFIIMHTAAGTAACCCYGRMLLSVPGSARSGESAAAQLGELISFVG